MTRSERIARQAALQKSAEDKQFTKQFHRIRMSLYHLREGGLLYSYLSEKEKITQKVNERMFAEEDDVLLSRRMNLTQFIRYANDQEAKVAECIWKAARRGQHSRGDIAKSCSLPTIWDFSSIWVNKQIAWHQRHLDVHQAQQPSSEHNKTNRLMAIAWAIANN